MGRPSFIATRWLVPALAAALYLGLPVAAVSFGAGPAVALPETCPGASGGAVEVTVTGPRADSHVSGTVAVTGRVRALVDLFQVELFVGDSLRDRMTVDPPARSVDYDLAWDSSRTPPGPHIVSIVACGGVPGEGRLAKGLVAATVQVDSPGQVQAPGHALPMAPPRDGNRKSRTWVGIVMVVPALAGLGYGLGVGVARRRPPRGPG